MPRPGLGFPIPPFAWPHVGRQWPAYNVESDQADGLAAWWPLLQSGYTTCPARWTLTPHGTPDRVMTTRGPAVGLSMGDSEYLDVSYPVVIDEPCALSVWYKPVGVTTYDTYTLMGVSEAANPDGFRLDFLTKNPATTVIVRAVTRNAVGTSIASSAEIAGVDDWVQLLAVFRSATDREIYMNGLSVGTDTFARSPDSADLDVTTLGAWQESGGASQHAQGYLSDTRFYNRAFNDAQAYQIYANLWELHQLPQRLWRLGVVAPPPPTIIPVVMHHYRSMRL